MTAVRSVCPSVGLMTTTEVTLQSSRYNLSFGLIINTTTNYIRIIIYKLRFTNVATVLIFEVTHDKFNEYGICNYLDNNFFPKIKYSNVKTTMYNIAFLNVPPAAERHRLKCYDNDWFIKLQLC